MQLPCTTDLRRLEITSWLGQSGARQGKPSKMAMSAVPCNVLHCEHAALRHFGKPCRENMRESGHHTSRTGSGATLRFALPLRLLE
mmetsp:Transcript_13947/g.32734  ORF Transcript_13947/g.32734 Transcript_13947/m.32734 type:complete len:86 (-) Transcript_13947:1176-1433(-)